MTSKTHCSLPTGNQTSAIIRCLLAGPRRLSDLACRTDIPIRTAERIVQALREQGAVMISSPEEYDGNKVYLLWGVADRLLTDAA